jgi:hypothetical protein
VPKKKSVSKPHTFGQAGQISFDLIKGTQFRGIHADGVWGGVTPQGLFSLTFYNERFPIPRQLTHTLKEDGTLGPEIEGARLSRSALVREAEFCVYMNLNVVKALSEFLQTQLEKIEVATKTKGQNGRKLKI